MKIYLAVLVLFLIAFAGLAAGLILKRKGLRGGCRPATGTDRDCQCKSVTDPGIKAGGNRHVHENEHQKGEENRPV
jgi:hypothetical protein